LKKRAAPSKRGARKFRSLRTCRVREVAGLPATIRVAPGRLEISYTDPPDLLRQLMELAHAVSNDYEGFEARLSPG
jgi:hypothetical protein